MEKLLSQFVVQVGCDQFAADGSLFILFRSVLRFQHTMQRHHTPKPSGEDLPAGRMFRQNRNPNELSERVPNQQNDLYHTCGHSLVRSSSPGLHSHINNFGSHPVLQKLGMAASTFM